MPIYHFHLQDEKTLRDDAGSTLPDIAAAREHAIGVAKELTFRSEKMLGQDWSRWTLRVEDSEGKEILSLALGDFTNGNT
jgi:hypothetical protein